MAEAKAERIKYIDTIIAGLEKQKVNRNAENIDKEIAKLQKEKKALQGG